MISTIDDTATATPICGERLHLDEFPDILTTEDVIRYLRVPGSPIAAKKTLYRLRKRKRLKSFKVGRDVRFTKAAVLGYLDFQQGIG